jgi:hypothetical protein
MREATIALERHVPASVPGSGWEKAIFQGDGVASDDPLASFDQAGWQIDAKSARIGTILRCLRTVFEQQQA